MTEQEQKDFEWASSYYLYDDLDSDWVNWSEEKLNDELENLAWQPFENWEGKDIYIEIIRANVEKYKFIYIFLILESFILGPVKFMHTFDVIERLDIYKKLF